MDTAKLSKEINHHRRRTLGAAAAAQFGMARLADAELSNKSQRVRQAQAASSKSGRKAPLHSNFI
jgi:hypothetical protein